MTNWDDDRACGAIWYHDSGGGREKHWCHRTPGHRDQHHSDHRSWWIRRPYARQIRLDEHKPCTDCKPADAKTPEVTEHQMIVRECPSCGERTRS